MTAADPLATSAVGEPQGVAHILVALDPGAFDVDGGSSARLERLARSVSAAGGRLPGVHHPFADEIGDDEPLELGGCVVATLIEAATACS